MKSTHEAWRTALSVRQIKDIIGHVLSSAEIQPLNYGPLDDYEIGILAEQRWKLFGSNFGIGLAGVQVIVSDNGPSRTVEVIALGTSFGEGVVAGLAKDVSSVYTYGSSKKMAKAVSDAVVGADSRAVRI